MFNYYFNDYLIKDTTDPISYSLMKIDWRIFGTFTYNRKYFLKNDIKEKEMVSVCPKMFFFALRSRFRIKKKNFELYYLNETDEMLKTHIHFLLSKKTLQNVNYFDLVEFCVVKWNSLNGLYNTQKDIQLIDTSRKENLVRYVCKRKTGINGIADNDYYMSKTLFRTLSK